MNSDIFKDHMRIRMLSLSIFTYSESPHFSEILEVSYIMLGVLQTEKPFNFLILFKLYSTGQSRSSEITHDFCRISDILQKSCIILDEHDWPAA